MDADAVQLLRDAYETLGLSARGHDRILRVARTLCDLEAVEKHITEENGVIGGTLKKHHITEAAQMRVLDRQYW
jgi:magnesium chelatase family protein